jgi:hypothetical protein
MDARQGLPFIACPNSGANDYARPFARSPRISQARPIAASQRLCSGKSAYRIGPGKHTICAAEPSVSYRAASRLCAVAIAGFFGPSAGTSGAGPWGCRKSAANNRHPPPTSGFSMMTAHTPAPPCASRCHLGVLKCPIRWPVYLRAFCVHRRPRIILASRVACLRHRTYATGPTCREIGGRVIYALDDLKAWAGLGAKTSTSDPGKGIVLPAKKNAVLRP